MKVEEDQSILSSIEKLHADEKFSRESLVTLISIVATLISLHECIQLFEI